MFVEILLIRDAGHILKNDRRERRAIIGIGGNGSRRIHLCRNIIPAVDSERIEVCHVFNSDTARCVLEPGRVRHQVSHGDRLAGIRIRNRKISQIGVDISIQIDLPLFHQLHDTGPGKEFGD